MRKKHQQTPVAKQPNRIIIENRTDIPIADVLLLVRRVVSMGRISRDKKQYCYLASYTVDGQEYHLVSDLNKKSDKFVFYKVPQIKFDTI